MSVDEREHVSLFLRRFDRKSSSQQAHFVGTREYDGLTSFRLTKEVYRYASSGRARVYPDAH